MKIENSTQANYYYNHIHSLLKEYTEQWNILPSSLRKYFKKGSKKYKSFLERNDLISIKGIEIIFNDILDDMSSFEKEYVMKFESFVESNTSNSIISSLRLNIKEADIKTEKFLADFFDTNLSNITLLSPSKHLYNIEDWDEEKKVYVFSKENLFIMMENLVKYLYDDFIKKEISTLFMISFMLDDLISFDDFFEKINKIITEPKLIEIISSLLSSTFLENKNDFYIWKSNI